MGKFDKMLDFKISRTISIASIKAKSDICEEGFRDFIEFLIENEYRGSLTDDIPKELIEKAFDRCSEWRDWAFENGFISGVFERIDCSCLHKDLATNNLYDLTFDDEKRIAVILNINDDSYECLSYDEILAMTEIQPDDDKPCYFEIMREALGYNFINTGKKLREVIYKKVIGKTW